MTHGEKWFAELQKIKANPVDSKYCVAIRGLPARLGYKEAIAYYNKKFRDYFEQQLTIKQFDKVEDYFGYYEAIKIRNEIQEILNAK